MNNNFSFRSFKATIFWVACIILISCNHPKAALQSGNKAEAGAVDQVKPAQHGANPYPIIPQKDFTRLWDGAAYCNGDTQGVAASLNLSRMDSSDVYVSGFLGSKNKVEARIRGYMVLIKPQNIGMAEGNYMVEGSFVLSNDRSTFKGFYTTKYNGKTDSCKAVLHPQR